MPTDYQEWGELAALAFSLNFASPWSFQHLSFPNNSATKIEMKSQCNFGLYPKCLLSAAFLKVGERWKPGGHLRGPFSDQGSCSTRPGFGAYDPAFSIWGLHCWCCWCLTTRWFCNLSDEFPTCWPKWKEMLGQNPVPTQSPFVFIFIFTHSFVYR